MAWRLGTYANSKLIYSILPSEFSQDRTKLKGQVSSSIDHSREYHGATSAVIASRSHLHSSTSNPSGKGTGELFGELFLQMGQISKEVSVGEPRVLKGLRECCS